LDRATAPECGYAWGEADALHVAGRAHLKLGELDQAREMLTAALALRKRLGHAEVNRTRFALEELLRFEAGPGGVVPEHLEAGGWDGRLPCDPNPVRPSGRQVPEALRRRHRSRMVPEPLASTGGDRRRHREGDGMPGLRPGFPVPGSAGKADSRTHHPR